VRISGCSQAAKCPPRSTSLKYTRFVYACSTQLRGAWYISSGKTLTATGTVTFLAAKKVNLFSQYRRDEEIAVSVSQKSVMLSRTSSRVRPPSSPAKAREISS
jgi:hypothetical protein